MAVGVAIGNLIPSSGFHQLLFKRNDQFVYTYLILMMYPTAKVKYEQMGEGLKKQKYCFVSKLVGHSNVLYWLCFS
jgi:ACR3 family arsenite efflux pump ArsB